MRARPSRGSWTTSWPSYPTCSSTWMMLKVEAISKYPRPTTCSQLLSFLGMINFYRRFIRGAASILKPLTDATKDSGPKHRMLDWQSDMEQASV